MPLFLLSQLAHQLDEGERRPSIFLFNLLIVQLDLENESLIGFLRLWQRQIRIGAAGIGYLYYLVVVEQGKILKLYFILKGAFRSKILYLSSVIS